MKKIKCLILVVLIIFANTCVFAETNEIKSKESDYADYLDISDWAKKDVQKAYERKLMIGQYNPFNELYFNPKGEVTFGETFSLIMNLVKNKDLDIEELIKKFEYPSINLWAGINNWNSRGPAIFYRSYLTEKYKAEGNKSWQEGEAKIYPYCTSFQSVVPNYYYNMDINKHTGEGPDDFLEDWGGTRRELADNFHEKSKKEQLEYPLKKDLERINNETDEAYKALMKKAILFYDYRIRTEWDAPTGINSHYMPAGFNRYVVNNFEERYQIQKDWINPFLYPDLQNKEHWAWPVYEELIEYMYLNGIIDEENITFDTPIRKDQFASMIYWVLAVSGQSFDFTGAPPCGVGKMLERLSIKGFNEFVNLPEDPKYAYTIPLNILKELEIMIGEGGNTIQYNSNITREQAALILNKVYEFTKDHSRMNRYRNVNLTPRERALPWYKALVASFSQLDENLFPYKLNVGWYSMTRNRADAIFDDVIWYTN